MDAKHVGEELYQAAHHAAACLVDLRDEVELPPRLRQAIDANVRAVGLAMAHWKALEVRNDS